MEKLPADRYPSMQALIHELEDFLATRVVINYNAYMVNYLKDNGVLSDDEASVILATGAVRAGQKIVREDRRSVRQTGLVFAAALCVMLFGGLAIQLLYSDATALEGKPSEAFSPGSAGFLEVAVEPWANVRVDGVDMALTPFAQPLSLAPGVHYVELSNPYFRPVTQEVRVVSGKTLRLVEQLSVDGGRDTAPTGGGSSQGGGQ